MPGALDSAMTLEKRMARLGVREEDIVESFMRPHSSSGQRNNKTTLGVHLKHLPTGLEVECQSQSSQLLNRALARHILLSKIAHKLQLDILQRQSAKAKLIPKGRLKIKTKLKRKKVS